MHINYYVYVRSRSLKTEALSMYSLRLSMYVMLMSRSLKTTERKTLYYCNSACILCLCLVL